MFVKDVMTAELLTVREDEDLPGLARLLSDNRISGAPVVDGDGYWRGMVTLFDLATQVAKQEGTVSVAEIMNPAVYSVSPETDLLSLSDFFLQSQLDSAVVTEQGRVVGIVTATDLLRCLTENALARKEEELCLTR